MHVRPARDGDLPDLVRIYNQAIEHTTATFDVRPVSIDDRQAWYGQFDPDENPLVVCELEDGRVAGYAYYVAYRAKPAYAKTKELSVYVDGACRGSGVGSALYRALLDHARERGVHALIAVIGGDNPASEALHQRFGFQRVGRLREVGWKFDAWVDTELWQKLL